MTHVMFPVINALWANHKVHHSGEVYLLVNAFRVTFATDIILSVRISFFNTMNGSFT